VSIPLSSTFSIYSFLIPTLYPPHIRGNMWYLSFCAWLTSLTLHSLIPSMFCKSQNCI
jgi:hypothetical protein